MIDIQCPGNPSEVKSIDVQTHRLVADSLRIANLMRFSCISSVTDLTLIPLATRWIDACFDLLIF